MGFKHTIFDALNCLGTFKTFKTRQVFLNNLYINKICAFNVKLESYVLHTNTFFFNCFVYRIPNKHYNF